MILKLNHCAAVILAGGKGSRMGSTHTNKVTLPLGNQPMIQRTVTMLHQTGIKNLVVVVGFAAASVKNVLKNTVIYAHQPQALGTADAFGCGLAQVPASCDTVISLYGDDSAFYPSSLLKRLLHEHHQSHAVMTLLTLKVADPTGLGRIIRDSNHQIQKIVEEKNASAIQKNIQEINAGLYIFSKSFISQALTLIKKNPISQEYYLTDALAIAVSQNQKVTAVFWPDASVWHGVNTPKEWQSAQIKLGV